MKAHRQYVLLTGSTGLLGEYLIRDLLDSGVLLAVIARPSRGTSPRQRISTICRRWQRLRGQALPRPVVLEGELSAPGWGLSDDQQRWIATNCDTLLNNAASLKFVADSRDSEPWVTNFHGTAQMLELAERWKISELHHISTAYVSGRRSGMIRENELDIGQSFGNDYEASKCASELMIRDVADRFRSVTVYRPAIITGDYRTGYTSTFHGLYAPLKIAATLLFQAPLFEISQQSLVDTLGLSGSEEKNFVSVDWVSEVIRRIVCDRSLHGQTYHLTAEHRTRCEVLAEAMHESFAEHAMEVLMREIEKAANELGSGSRPSRSSTPTLSLTKVQASFRSQMEIYQAYWRNDPYFDRTNLTAALPDLPPPPIDHVCVRRLCRYALKTNFGWPKPAQHAPPIWANDLLGAENYMPSPDSAHPSRKADINLRVLGDGGGDFAIFFQAPSRRTVGGATVCNGFDLRQPIRWTMSTATLRRIIEGRWRVCDAIRSGAIVLLKLKSPEQSRSDMQPSAQVASVSLSLGPADSETETDFKKVEMERWIATMLQSATVSSSS